MVNNKIARRIESMFRSSEIITVNEEAVTPIYKVRQNVARFSITENELRSYLIDNIPVSIYCRQEYLEQVELLLQKIYHPTANDLNGDEPLRLSSLR